MAKRMMVGLAVVAACGVLMGDGVAEFITDRSGYVTLGADNASGKSSFNSSLSWSDSAAPSAGKDYLIQGNHIMRILGSGGTFAGRSLTLDNGRIKSGFNDNAPRTATIDDLRIYGGRLENSVGGSTLTYEGNIHVLGTVTVPARISGCSGRTFNINSTLHGGTENAVRVMMTEEDAGAMNANYFTCWFNADNSATYRGRFFVTGGNGSGSGAAWGHKISLHAKSLANLGAGDPDAQTSVLTLQNRGAFFGANGMAFTNPAYSIAIDGTGTLGGENAAGAKACGLEVGGGVRIRGLAADSTLYIVGTAPVLLDNVQISNIGKIVIESGSLRLGSDYTGNVIELAVNPGATLTGASEATVGSTTFSGASSFSPGAAAGEIAELKVRSASLANVVTGAVDIVREGGVLRADHLTVSGKLTKAAGAKLVFKIGSFPSGTDWEGSVCLLSASNLGEADGLQVEDVEITGFPPAWAGARDSGEFSIESDGDTKYLMWNAKLTDAPVVRILPLGDDITAAAGSYRAPLAAQLADAGYNSDFVGACADGSLADPDHEGHAGWTLADAETWLGGTSLAAPHFILLHLGMNDLAGNDFAHATDRLARLVDGLTAKYPATWVVVSTLLAQEGDDAEAVNAQIDTLFNARLAELVAERSIIGRRVALCDQHAAVAAENLADDGVHPTADGYAQMAAAWFTAIRAIMTTPMVAPSSIRTDLISLAGVDQGTPAESSWNTGLHWENGQPPVAGVYYFVPTNTLLRTPDNQTPQPFAGESLIFNGGKMNIKHTHNTRATANWVLYDCQLAHGCSGQKDANGKQIPWVLILDGTMDVRGTAAAPTRFVGSGAGDSRTLMIDAAMRGGPDALVAIAHTPGEADAASKGFRCELRGDNSAYQGRFLVDREGATGFHVAHFNSHAALGAPVADGPKLTLRNGTTLSGAGIALTNGYAVAVEGTVTFSTTWSEVSISGRRVNEGIYLGNGGSITGDGTTVIKVSNDSGGALALDDVALTGIAGLEIACTMRVYPGYENPDVPLTLTGEGMLADNSDGIGDVTLNGHSRLQPGFGQTGADAYGRYTMTSLTMNDNSYLIISAGELNGVVTSDFIRVRGDLVNARGTPIPIHFDAYPTATPIGTRIPLLSAANLGTGVTAADFVAMSEDAFIGARLEGAFEIAERDGENVLFYVTGARPIVRLKAQDGSGTDSWASSRNWDNGLSPCADYDYLIPAGTLLRRSTSGDSSVFAGHSLSIQDGGDFAINGLTAKVDDLRLFSNGILTTRNNGNANRLQGTATVYAQKGKPFNFEIESANGQTRTLNLEATLQGTGDLRFRYYHTSTAPGAVCTYYIVTADNSGFTGGIELFQRAVCADFKDERAMGGPAPAFRADRLLFTSNATLRCSASYVMSDPTRGITFGAGVLDGALDGGTIEVAAGQTLTISNRIAGTTSLRKAGLGTLVLCCATNTFSGTVRNQGSSDGSYGAGGIIAVGHADALANATLEIYSNTVWRVDAPEGMTVKGLDAVVQNGSRDGRFLVRPLAFENAKGGKIEANLVRFLGATAADAETALALVEVDASPLGKSWKIETEAVPEEGALLVRATAAPASMVIILR